MNRLKPLGTLLLVTAFTVVQLLATAPLLHPRCNLLGNLTLRGPNPSALHTPEGTSTGSPDECPVCMVSGLAAVLAPSLAVFAPSVQVTAPPLPVRLAVRSLSSDNLRSRAPPVL